MANGPERWPVVIVGAGPVGMTLAHLLGRYEVPCLLLERETRLFDRPRAVGTDFDCLRAWQAIGIADRLLVDMVPCGPLGLGLTYHDPSGRPFLDIRPEGSPYGFAMAYGFIQPLVDRELLRSLSGLDCVEVRLGHSVEAVDVSGDVVELRGKVAAGGGFRLLAEYVVACDGGSSRVREDLGIRMCQEGAASRWLVLDALAPRGDTPLRSAAIHCDPARPRVCIPRRHGHRRFEFMLHSEESAEEFLGAARIDQMLALFGAGDVQVVRSVVANFRGAVAERFRSGRVLLAGDAAHVTPPFAGQGLAIGVRDAFGLAWRMALVVHGRADARLLESYDEERRPHAWKSVRLALRLGRLMMPTGSRAARWQAGLVRLAGRLPGVGAWLREGGPRPQPRYQGKLFRGRGIRHRAGQMIVQPRVRTADAEVPLDEALGTGWAWLHFGEEPLLHAEAEAVLAALDARRLRVLPRTSVPRALGEIEDVEGKLLWWLGPTRGRALLVRPDRFVCVDTRGAAASADLADVGDRLALETRVARHQERACIAS